MARIEEQRKRGTCLFSYHAQSEKDTQYFAKVFMDYIFSKKIKICAFFGELGSGKTFLIRSMIHSLKQIPENFVVSPTFTYLNIYPTTPKIYHFDLYRLQTPDDFDKIGGYELFFENNISLIEWADRIESFLDKQPVVKIYLTSLGKEERLIEVFGL